MRTLSVGRKMGPWASSQTDYPRGTLALPHGRRGATAGAALPPLPPQERPRLPPVARGSARLDIPPAKSRQGCGASLPPLGRQSSGEPLLRKSSEQGPVRHASVAALPLRAAASAAQFASAAVRSFPQRSSSPLERFSRPSPAPCKELHVDGSQRPGCLPMGISLDRRATFRREMSCNAAPALPELCSNVLDDPRLEAHIQFHQKPQHRQRPLSPPLAPDCSVRKGRPVSPAPLRSFSAGRAPPASLSQSRPVVSERPPSVAHQASLVSPRMASTSRRLEPNPTRPPIVETDSADVTASTGIDAADLQNERVPEPEEAKAEVPPSARQPPAYTRSASRPPPIETDEDEPATLSRPSCAAANPPTRDPRSVPSSPASFQKDSQCGTCSTGVRKALYEETKQVATRTLRNWFAEARGRGTSPNSAAVDVIRRLALRAKRVRATAGLETSSVNSSTF
mmetsp:Transcript_24533/g.64487  ORF Transcript_24533/g.64487 Transcript_24533/m.64487 type:complete len:454 (-) Transcript_24533:489-1850(-)